MSRKAKFFYSVLLMLPVFALAQNQTYTAKLDAVPETGFYKIEVDTALSAHLKTDLSDIRISDGAHEVPYVVYHTPSVFRRASFREFPILSNTIGEKGKSLIEIENKAGTISSLSFIMANANVQRGASLSGSNDRGQWFIIAERLSFYPSTEKLEDHYVQSIDFAPGKYKYFKLVIDNGKSDPLNILQAGNFTGENGICQPEEYISNGRPYSLQIDSNKHSYIQVTQRTRYPIDRIEFKAAGTKFFERAAVIYNDENSKGDPMAVALHNFTISSDHTTVTLPSKVKASTFLIVIDNRDNPPVYLTDIIISQKKQSIVAWLEKGKQYSLLADDPKASFPDYDLEHFRDSIPAQLAILRYDKLTPVGVPATIAEKPADKKPMLIWVAIIIAVLVLGGFTFSMMKDMKKKGL